MPNLIRLLFVCFFFSNQVSLAQAEQSDLSSTCKWGAPSFMVDQDWFVEALPSIPQLLTPNEDRDYTMGLMFSLNHCMGDKNPLAFFGVQKTIPKLFRADLISLENTRSNLSVVAFTPDGLGEIAVIPNDRPYASLISLTNSVVFPINGKDEAFESSFSVGVLGLNLAEKFQTWFHRHYRESHNTLTPVDPLGWPNQISNGGEPTAMYSILWLKRTVPQFGWMDMVTSVEGTIGYNTTISIGFMSKFGRINKFTRVENIVRNGGIRYATPLSNEGNNRAEIYFLFGMRGKFVAYNALLQGQFRQSKHEFNTDQIKHLVYDYSIGIGASLFNYRLQTTCTKRGSEHNLSNRRSHSWCGVTFAYGF